RLDTYLTRVVRLTDQERRKLLGGAPVTKLLDADPGTEVAVFGAVWVAAPPASYARAVSDIESFERGNNFQVTKKISDPPQLQDFAHRDVLDDDIRDRRACRVGDYEMKLSQQALDSIRKVVEWSRPTGKTDV